MRPIFCGNFEYDARQSDLERLFSKYGKVERVDMKSGFAFVYMDDERDAEDAIRGLDRAEFGRQGRRLRVEWTKQERGIRRPVGSRRSSGSSRPTKTLFVINFDPIHTRTRDLERHFDPYGKILNIRIRRNFAFIQFELQEDATKALDATNMSKLMDRVISVEYAVRDDDERKNGYSPDRRGRGRSSERSRDRGRSSSPYRRERASPDYGHGPVSNKRHDTRESPYGRERASPDYGRGPSPVKRRETRESPYEREKASPDNGRAPSPVKRRERRDSSYERERASPRDPSPIKRREMRESSYERERASPRGPSPVKRREPRESSYDRERASPRGPSPIKRRESRESPYERERGSPDFGRGPSPPAKRHASRESPEFDRPKSPEFERYRSRSPSAHE